MKQLFYVSNSSLSFKGQEDIDKILQKASSHNSAHGISGILLYHSGIFLQFIEGADDEVKKLYSKIFSDPRHNNVTLLFDIEAQHRIFSEWGMAYREVSGLDIEMINKMLSWTRLIQRSPGIDNQLILQMLEEFRHTMFNEKLPNLSTSS